MKRVVGLLATLYRELRDSYKIFRPEWDWWRWGIGLWFDADLDPGFDSDSPLVLYASGAVPLDHGPRR